MRKSLIVILSVAIALAFAGRVIAQTNPPEKMTPVHQTNPPAKPTVSKMETKAPAKTVAKAAAPAALEKEIMGTAVSVDAVANTIVVKWKDADRTFKVDPAAKIMVGGKEGKLADIQKNTKVTVVYKVVGKDKVALMIM